MYQELLLKSLDRRESQRRLRSDAARRENLFREGQGAALEKAFAPACRQKGVSREQKLKAFREDLTHREHETGQNHHSPRNGKNSLRRVLASHGALQEEVDRLRALHEGTVVHFCAPQIERGERKSAGKDDKRHPLRRRVGAGALE